MLNVKLNVLNWPVIGMVIFIWSKTCLKSRHFENENCDLILFNS